MAANGWEFSAGCIGFYGRKNLSHPPPAALGTARHRGALCACDIDRIAVRKDKECRAFASLVRGGFQKELAQVFLQALQPNQGKGLFVKEKKTLILFTNW
jgi:hypothetical protein